MGFTIDKASLVAIFIESVLYGGFSKVHWSLICFIYKSYGRLPVIYLLYVHFNYLETI